MPDHAITPSPITLKPYQQQIHDFLVANPFAGAWLGVGAGKAQPLHAKVLTPTGFISMADVEIGTEIVTPNGEISVIDGVFPQGRRPVYQMHLHDGRVIESDEDHIWSVATGKHRAKGTFVHRTTRELLDDLRMKSGSPKWAIAQITPVDLGKWASSIDPWLLGVLLGDGGLTCGSPALSMPDPEILGWVTDLLPAGVSPTKQGDTDDYYLSNSKEWHNNTLLNELRRLGLAGHGSGTKFIPRELLHAPVTDRLALLQGLLDTDGSPSHSGFEVTFKSEQLADDVQWLVHSLGGRASKSKKLLSTGPYAGNVYHRVYGRLPNNMEPFRLTRKRTARRPHNSGRRQSYDTLYTSISRITFKGYEPTQCIRVADPLHEYVTDGFVRTHNTLSTLSVLQTVRPIGHILVVAPVAIARSTWLDEIDKWGFPINTKSLIVDENDRQLSKDKRLARFQEIHSDSPTMYFINQEMLTQSSQDLHVLVPVTGATGTQAFRSASNEARDLLGLLQTVGPRTRDELIDLCRDHASTSGQTVPPKSHVTRWIKELTTAGLITRERHDCRSCDGDGCQDCCFGLVDQMPIQSVNGRKSLIWPFQTVIIDESQGFKSHGSNRFKALKQVRPAISRLIELTGTPAPNGLHDLWSQVYLLDQGQALGKNITEFRNRWFVPKMVPGTTTPAKWIPTANAEQEIYDAIGHLVMSAQNTDLQLPGLTIQDVNVSLPPDLIQAYKDFKRDLVIDVVATYKGEDGELTQSVESIVADNQAVLTSKLIQFASGTLYTADPDDPSTKGRYEIIHDKKIEMAEYLVRNSGGDPVLLAYHFRSDLEQLLARFKKAGIDAQAFDGSREMVRRWNAKQIPVMLLHPAAAGHGLNLQDGGSTMIWYTLPFSLEHYLQTNGRLYRTGQTKPVTIHRLITKGTQDERMPGVLAEKKRVQDNLIDAVSGEELMLAALEEEIQDDLSDLWISDRI